MERKWGTHIVDGKITAMTASSDGFKSFSRQLAIHACYIYLLNSAMTTEEVLIWVCPRKRSKNKRNEKKNQQQQKNKTEKRLWHSEFLSASNLTPTLAGGILIFDSCALCAWRCVCLFCRGLAPRSASWSSGSDTALVRTVTADLSTPAALSLDTFYDLKATD